MSSLTKFQQEVVEATDKPVNIVAVGTGSGSSFAGMARAIDLNNDQVAHVTVVLPSRLLAVKAFNSYVQVMSMLGYRASKASMIFTNKRTGNMIRFLSIDNNINNLIGLYDELIIERPQHLSKEVHTEINKRVKSGLITVTFLTNPYYCGGQDDWDNIYIKYLANFKTVWKELPDFKAQPQHYHDWVNIITGYDHEDNPYLSKSFGECIDSLNPSDKERLSGTWKQNELK